MFIVTLQEEKSYRNLELAKEMAITARAALAGPRNQDSAQANLFPADLNFLLPSGALPHQDTCFEDAK